jgi:histidine triad (HIT) family protein
MSEDCIFCAIIAGQQPAHIVLDDEVAVAFLDTPPLF